MRIKSAPTYRGRSASLKSATWKVGEKQPNVAARRAPDHSHWALFDRAPSVVSGSPLPGPSEGVRGLVFGFLPTADLPASAPLTHTPQHAHVHQPAQHGHEVHAL